MDNSRTLPSNLAQVQDLFHGLIRSRVRKGGITIPRHLPQIAKSKGTQEKPTWFPVDGMYGGFAYWIVWTDSEPILHTQSWCRIEGSGQYHVITPNEIHLVEEGFV